ncbi:MAG: hypothetical protein ABI746_13210 [Dermatophilaceae bacterium]
MPSIVMHTRDERNQAAVKNGDATHESAHDDMRGRWKHPKQSLGWYLATKKAFAELAED